MVLSEPFLIDRRCETLSPPSTFASRVISRLKLGGGLVNQVFSLQVLVMYAKQSGAALMLPEFGSHIDGSATGVKNPKPRSQTFEELFDFDCLAAALSKNGILVLRERPSGAEVIKPGALFAKEKLAQGYLLRQYTKYKAAGTGHIGPVFSGGPPIAVARELEDAVYRGLHPSPRLIQHVRAVITRLGLRDMRYGCVHARIENDMQRWWYYIAKLRPLSMPDILRLLGTVETIRSTPTIFVAVGSDLRASDEALLSRNRTPWDASLLRRATPGDESGGLLRRSAGDEDPQELTYVEASLIDLTVCRLASWFAGWPSSSFSAALAHYRYLDYAVNRSTKEDVVEKALYYEYCGDTANREASISQVLATRLPSPEHCKHMKSKRSSTNASSVLSPANQGPANHADDDKLTRVPATEPLEAETRSVNATGNGVLGRAETLARALENLADEDEKRLDELFANFECQHLYFDVGR